MHGASNMGHITNNFLQCVRVTGCNDYNVLEKLLSAKLQFWDAGRRTIGVEAVLLRPKRTGRKGLRIGRHTGANSEPKFFSIVLVDRIDQRMLFKKELSDKSGYAKNRVRVERLRPLFDVLHRSEK